MFATLFAFDPAPASAIRLVADHLLTEYESALAADDRHTRPMEPWIAVTEFNIANMPIGLEDLYSGKSITLDPEPRLITIRAVEVLDLDEMKPYEATIRFDVILLGRLTIWGYELDSGGNAESTTTTLVDQLIEAPMIAEVQDLTLHNLTSDGPAIVSDSEQRFPNGQEAWQWLADTLIAFEGVTAHPLAEYGALEAASDDPGLLLIEEDELALQSLSGRTVMIGFTGTLYDDWTGHFETRDVSVEVVCRYDPGVRVWVRTRLFRLRRSVLSGV